MKNTLWLALSMPFLSACFFTQEQPKTNMAASQQSYLLGEVVFRDFQISNQVGQATVTAEFFKQTDKKTKPVNSLLGEPGNSDRAPKCKSQLVDFKTSENRSETEAEPNAFVGDVYFGLAYQSNFSKLKKNADNLYGGIFEPNPPAYIYQVVVGGTETIPQFASLLTMPEQLEWIRVNGVDFGSPAMEYRKGEKLEMYWREPKQENSENRILVMLSGKTEKQGFLLQCEAYESDFMSVSSMKNWTIDASFLSDIPTGAKIGVHLVRRNLRVSDGQHASVVVEGRRQFYSTLDFIE